MKNIEFTNYASVNGDILRCNIIKEYAEDSTASVRAYYSDYHSEFKYVNSNEILTKEEGELLLSKIDRHHGVYVKALNIAPDNLLEEMNTSEDVFYWMDRDGFSILKYGHNKTYADSNEWGFIKIRSRVLKVCVYNAFF